MIVVVEPTYAGDDHAAVNGAILQSLSIACGPVLFAATAKQHAGVAEALKDGLAEVATETIHVMPPGGVKLRRMWGQHRFLSDIVGRHRPEALVLLSAGPETLFAARWLATRHHRLRILAVMHGNISGIVGWRSRDPRRRLIDMTSSLRAARHPRIQLVVLEATIKDRLATLIPNRIVVWPMPTNHVEQPAWTRWTPPRRLTLTCVGSANREKGFAGIIAMQKQTGALYQWAVTGTISAEFAPEDVEVFTKPSRRLNREDYLAEVRKADYAVITFGQDYALTASASLLDCFTQRKPVIALRTAALSSLEAEFGAFGYLCDGPDAMLQLVMEPGRLRDEAAYAGFQRTLDTIHAARLPDALAVTLRTDIGCQ